MDKDFIATMEYYSARKKKEILAPLTTWWAFRDFATRDKSDRERKIWHDFKKQNKTIQKLSGCEIENKLSQIHGIISSSLPRQ